MLKKTVFYWRKINRDLCYDAPQYGSESLYGSVRCPSPRTIMSQGCVLIGGEF